MEDNPGDMPWFQDDEYEDYIVLEVEAELEAEWQSKHPTKPPTYVPPRSRQWKQEFDDQPLPAYANTGGLTAYDICKTRQGNFGLALVAVICFAVVVLWIYTLPGG